MRKQFLLKAILLLSVILLCEDFFCPASRAALKGGCAKVNITPPVGAWLSGYGGRDKPSDGIVDELYARALVLDNGSNSVAIISVDLLWVPLQMTNRVRGILKDKIGIPEQNILICATHTHFGPKIYTETKIGPEVSDNTVDSSYVQILVKKITDSAFLAHKRMENVKIGAVKGDIPEIVYNRRPTRADGSVQTTFSLPLEVTATRKIQRSPDGSVSVTFTFPTEGPALTFGPVDPEAWVLRVENAEGQIIGSVVNFACHAVSGSVFADWFYSISADYPGETMRVVEQLEGGVCLFTSGTAGDIVPLRRGRKPRYEIGRALAGEAIRRLQFVQTSGDIDMTAMTREVTLPIRQDLSPNRIIAADKGKTHLTTEIQVIRLGDIYILGLPGEVLVEVGLDIKKKAGFRNLIIAAVSNDTIGYVCHSQAYEQGGYEADSGTNLAKGAGEIIVTHALDLLSQVKVQR
ncbi:MAG: neutral/alkaline non-lysosomal ceramidase N-terminal domain-containing protein [Sedimentisphaerales bacterium]